MRTHVMVGCLVALCALAASGRELVVTSVGDAGEGTLRWALEAARPGDEIRFDKSAFPPTRPSTIYPCTELPPLGCGDVTIDASDAGVVIDGTNVPGSWNNGLQISGDHNTVMGLQIMNFKGSGFAVCTASDTRIGGDQGIGSGPTGQGNVASGNGIGIDLCDFGEGNVIVGNMIGTDASGEVQRGNTQYGIWIENGVSRTTIGPGNTIAYNGIGIEVSGPRSTGNTITRNSIHANGGVGIELRDAGNIGLGEPYALVIAEDSGSLTGAACPGCLVEVFSDESDEGAIYEGQARADEEGFFELRSETSFAGPRLVATATDETGNTSGFSSATLPLAGNLDLQREDASPKRLLSATRATPLADSHVGGSIGNWETQEYAVSPYQSLLASIRDLGIKWVRTNFWSPNPLNWQSVLREPGEYYIDPEVDAFITELANDGVCVILTLSHGAGLDRHEYGESCWGNPGSGMLGEREPERWFASQDERDAFCDYARFMVEHFRGRISYYEIWNEPSSGDYDCRGAVSVDDYAKLLRQVIPVISTADPEAHVIGGALGRFDDRERRWLLDLLRRNVGPLLDGLSWHPFYGNSPGQGADGPDYWEDYPSAVLDFMSQARELGFDGEYFVDEMVWRTPTDLVPTELPLYSDLQAAKYASRAIALHAGLGFREAGNQLLMPGVIKLVPRYFVIRNLSDSLSGSTAVGFPVEIDVDHGSPVAYSSFRYPNGDRMLAIWTDGVAQDEDPGIPATITFPGLASASVTGVDVLHGFEQRLAFEIDGEDTIVRDLLVKDYPILIRLSDVTFGAEYEETAGDGFHRLGDINAAGDGADRDGDGVPDEDDLCPDYPGDKLMNGC